MLQFLLLHHFASDDVDNVPTAPVAASIVTAIILLVTRPILPNAVVPTTLVG